MSRPGDLARDERGAERGIRCVEPRRDATEELALQELREQRRREPIADPRAQQHHPALAGLGVLPRLEHVAHDALAEPVLRPVEQGRDVDIRPHRRADGLGEQVGLRAEVVVQERRVHARARRDAAHRGAVVAQLAELLDRGGDDALPRVGLAAARSSAAPLRRRHGVLGHAVSLDLGRMPAPGIPDPPPGGVPMPRWGMAFGMRRNVLRPSDSPRADRVTYIELFFDLVFVFALTQLSAYLYENQTPLGALEGVIMICALWWAWVSTTWVTNWLDPVKLPVRGAVIALAFVALVMSVAIAEAFGDRAWTFAIAFVVLQVGRTGFIVWATARHDREISRDFTRMLVWLAAGAVLWIVGAVLPLAVQLPLWAAALGVELLGTLLGYPGAGVRPRGDRRRGMSPVRTSPSARRCSSSSRSARACSSPASRSSIRSPRRSRSSR